MSANKPMAFKLTPSLRSHAGNKLIKMNSGKPELKPVNTQISMRLLNKISLMALTLLTQARVAKSLYITIERRLD